MFKILFYKEENISKNKFYNFQLNSIWNLYYSIDIRPFTSNETFYFLSSINFFGILGYQTSWNKKQNHAGFEFDLTILFLNVCFQIYDNRHWDDENDCWGNHENSLDKSSEIP